MKRRLFLKSAIAGSAVATAVGAGLLMPSTVFAVSSDFKAQSDKITANTANISTGSFKFKVPKIVENSARVPMEVDASKIHDVTNISLLVRENSTPLVASFNLSGAVGFVAARVKIGKTSRVDALVTAGGSTAKVTKRILYSMCTFSPIDY